MSASDRGYTLLLGYLHRPTSKIPPLPTLQGLIVHYLTTLSPTPTPLAATVVSSPLFRPFSLAKLEALSTSFRHAVHAKLRVLKEEPSGVFSPSLNARLNNWSTSLLKGLEGGHAITRLACCSGLLLGLEDVLSRLPAKHRDVKASVEDELILAFADVIDLFTSSDSWGQEFQPVTEGGEDALTLPLIVSSQALLLVPPEKFVALPLPQMLSLVLRTITRTFVSGTFISSFPSSLEPHPDYRIYIKPESPFFEQITAIASSHAMQHMGSLSKLCSRTLSLFLDHRPKLALPRMQEAFVSLESVARNVEAGWLATNLAGIEEESIAPETRPLTASIWTVLKTLLFSTIMVAEAGLSCTPYLPQTLTHSSPSHALRILRTLSHLSFIIEKFGGAGHGAFTELKRAFYLALDILAADGGESEQFVKGVCDEVWQGGYAGTHSVQRAKKAFALAAVEQLVPVLSIGIIEAFVLPFCSPHLNDATHRETFESAHSVVLAIFSSCSKRALENTGTVSSTNEQGGTSTSAVDSAFTEKMIPFYTQCLIDNSSEGKLTTPQLRLAYAALVKSASQSPDASLAWFCLDTLLSFCQTPSSSTEDLERKHRLHLALISSLSSLPLILLPRALEAVRDIIESASFSNPESEAKRGELVDALFGEIMERIGDAEKEYAVRWWNEQRAGWAAAGRVAEVGGGEGKGKKKEGTSARMEGDGSEVIPRL
ncbi:hypothetical protein HYDPIDRAFT_118489 [Hydnomerulius pinastri MD-312]|uniref:Uncharacterized protein n=1 Tax=Hydnomerulius pinastri MD-312 TaxID=994086 RepID=A0A0C9V2K8_9AGAM|nr:hypothetical protein HYDPIDRAFT_118489 [Hydnomerulius pinastri MD-312]